MSDKKYPTPTPIPGRMVVVEKSRRLHSPTERELGSSMRDAAPIPKEFDVEEDSSAHDIEERARIREDRDEKSRIRKVESKIDQDRDQFHEFKLEVVERFGAVEGAIERVEGQIAGVSTTLTDLRSDLRIDREARQKEYLLEKEVRLKSELADKEAEQKLRHVRTTTDIEIGKAEKITSITTSADKIMWTRKLILQVVTGAFSAGVIGALLTLLAKRC